LGWPSGRRECSCCQKSITAKIAEGGGDYVFPVKDNQKSLKEYIETAFKEPVFPPVWFR
jgi:predicted transposase YbfD/YdcC